MPQISIKNGLHYAPLATSEQKSEDSLEGSEDKSQPKEHISDSKLLKGVDFLQKVSPLRHYVCDFLTVNPSRILIFCLLFLSAVILMIFRNQGGENVLLCKEVLSEKEITYPMVDFSLVKAHKDKGRYSTLTAENWIIVCVTEDPTDEVRRIAKLKGWQVLAIANSETVKDWSVPGVIYLSNEQQAFLGYRINKYLPLGSYIRKNIGYLFAIQHGAKMIYDIDEKQSLLGNDLAKFFDVRLHNPHKKLLQYRHIENRTTVNPFIHFGQRSVWPRGLPLTSIPKISADIFYNQVLSGRQYIQHGLTKGLPDVDFVFYNTRKVEGQPFDLDFDSHAPSVALPCGTMAPVNSLNTLFHYQAFWGLMLPISTGIYASDIVRGYWSQRLLWEIDGMLAIYPPSMFCVDRMEPSVYEDDELFLKSWEELVGFLVGWKSDKSEFFKRILDLSYELGQNGFWSAQDVELSAAWLKDLISVGYKQPILEKLDPNKVVASKFKHFKPHVFPAKYAGVREASIVDKDMGHLLRWRQFYSNIVLILDCTWPLNHTVLGWRLLYGRIFKHVIVLSQQADARLDVEEGGGWQTYKALPGIFERFPGAEGYLVVSDDAVLNYWNLLGANSSKLWNLHKAQQLWRVFSYNDTGPAWYLQNRMKRSVKKAIKSLSDNLKMTYRATMDDDHFVVCSPSVYYVPQRYLWNFVALVNVVSKAKVGHQLAMPLITLALDRPVAYDTGAFRKVCNSDENDATGLTTLHSSDCHLVYRTNSTGEHYLLQTLKGMSLSDPLLSAML